MRYQPAYVYSSARKFEPSVASQKSGWTLHFPRFASDQPRSTVLSRFFLIVVGLAMLVIGLAHFGTAFVAKKWEQTSVTITRAEVVRMPYEDGKPVFTAHIEYQYVQNGVQFKGDRISLHPIRSTSPGDVKREINTYAVGRVVLAHVNPDRPEKAYLTTNPNTYLYSLIIPGLVLIALGLAVGQFHYFKETRRQRKAWRFGEFKKPAMRAL